jgi:thioredoxin-like negative regulator of GroEL
MRRIIALAFALAAPAISATKSDLNWVSRFDQAAALAGKTGKPLLIEFAAGWCEPCERMDRESWPDARVVELSRRYVCVSVDTDHDASTASRFHVDGVPTIILTDPWAEPMVRHMGILNARGLAGLLEQLPADFSEAREAHEILAHDHNNGAALVRMGRFFTTAKAPQHAIQYYGEALKSKACKSDAALRSELSLAIGLDYVQLENWDDAQKQLQRFLKDFPGSPAGDQALYGLATAYLKQGKREEAGKQLSELKLRFPLSHATEAASRMLADDQEEEGRRTHEPSGYPGPPHP